MLLDTRKTVGVGKNKWREIILYRWQFSLLPYRIHEIFKFEIWPLCEGPYNLATSIDFEFCITDMLRVRFKTEIIDLIHLFQSVWRTELPSSYATNTATSNKVIFLKACKKFVHAF